MKLERNKVVILLIYIVSIIILLWLSFISFKDLVTSFNPEDDTNGFFTPMHSGSIPLMANTDLPVRGKSPPADLGVSKDKSADKTSIQTI